MRKPVKLAAAATLSALFASAPATAQTYGLAPTFDRGIGFSLESGGYCDRAGCPDGFWDYPISYCPAFYRGEWYSGPFYYRSSGTLLWIHGGWRSDERHGRRPGDACENRLGPALGYDFYRSHGFRWRDAWRERWYHDHGGRDRESNQTGRGGRNDWDRNGWRSNHGPAFVPAPSGKDHEDQGGHPTP